MSLLYWALRRLLELIVLRGRGGAGNEIELLVLRHQVAVLRRHACRPRFHPADGAVFAALARFLPSERWPSLPVSPATARRWHRDAVARRWTYPRLTPGRPPVDRPLRELIVRLARENPTWGYRRIQGEVAVLGTPLAASTVWRVLQDARPPPAPCRASESWLVFIELHTRIVHVAGVTANPTGEWVAQQARNLIGLLTDRASPVRWLIRDRDAKFSQAFDEVFRSDGIQIIRTPVRAPRANAVMERWFASLRRECLDRLLILGRRHLEAVLQIYAEHYNTHRPHRSLGQRAPAQIRGCDRHLADLAVVRRRDRLGGLLHEYETAA